MKQRLYVLNNSEFDYDFLGKFVMGGHATLIVPLSPEINEDDLSCFLQEWDEDKKEWVTK